MDKLFGIGLTLLVWCISLKITRRYALPLGILIICLVLVIFKIDLTYYMHGGKILKWFLTPAVIALAVPLYRQTKLLKKNALAIIISLVVGSLVSMFSVAVLSRILGVEKVIFLSLIPKSVTTAVGIEISKNIGGLQSIATVAIVTTGILGNVIAPTIMNLFNIKDKVAQGIAIGSASHAGGTSKAIEMGEKEGAFSGLAMGLSAMITVLIIPLVIKMLLIVG